MLTFEAKDQGDVSFVYLFDFPRSISLSMNDDIQRTLPDQVSHPASQ